METKTNTQPKTAGINRGLIALAAQLAILIAALILAQIPGANKDMLRGFSLGLFSVTAGTALLVLITSLRRSRIRNTPDERQRAIKEKSGLAAFFATLVLTIAFILASMTLPVLRSVDTTVLATISLLLMGLFFVSALLINSRRM